MEDMCVNAKTIQYMKSENPKQVTGLKGLHGYKGANAGVTTGGALTDGNEGNGGGADVTWLQGLHGYSGETSGTETNREIREIRESVNPVRIVGVGDGGALVGGVVGIRGRGRERGRGGKNIGEAIQQIVLFCCDHALRAAVGESNLADQRRVGNVGVSSRVCAVRNGLETRGGVEGIGVSEYLSIFMLRSFAAGADRLLQFPNSDVSEPDLGVVILEEDMAADLVAEAFNGFEFAFGDGGF
jgi:hypothetical protein